MNCFNKINDFDEDVCFHCYRKFENDRECYAGHYNHKIEFSEHDEPRCLKCDIRFSEVNTIYHNDFAYEFYFWNDDAQDYELTHSSNPDALFVIITGCKYSDDEFLTKEIIE